MKRLFRWALYLFIMGVVLVVAAVLLLDTVAREVLQSRLRAETGMDLKIGKVNIGLLTPTVSIEDFKLYNTAGFGGSPFLDMPELYVEYDKEAIRARKLHFSLIRLSIAEVNVFQDKKGRFNTQAIEEKSKAVGAAIQHNVPGFSFAGVDMLNLSFQKLRVSNLGPPIRTQEVDFHLTNQIFSNVKTWEDLNSVAVIMAGRGGAASTGGAPVDIPGLLRPLLH